MKFAYSNYTLYHQTKILIGFCCKQGLNFKSLIQLLNTLPNVVKLDDQNESRPKI